MIRLNRLILCFALVALLVGAITIGALAEEDKIPRATTVTINKTNFPDEFFRNYVSDEFDTNGDGKLSATEIKKATIINLEIGAAESLKGIEYFTYLEKLWCGDNELKSVDLSANTKLTELDLGMNNLTSLDVSKLTALKSLGCTSNEKLKKLDVSKCTQLTELSCSHCALTSLDVSKCTKLNVLFCNGCDLSSLDVSKCTQLTDLDCEDNNLTTLKLGNCTKLTMLWCAGNKLSKLDLKGCTKLIKTVKNGKTTSYSSGTITYYTGTTDYPTSELTVDKTVTLMTANMSTPDFTLPSKTVTLQAQAFMGAKMTVVVCPKTLKTIGSKAFANCKSLKQIYIPASVTSIASDAFSGCSGFTIFTPPGSTAQTYAKNKGYACEAYER